MDTQANGHPSREAAVGAGLATAKTPPVVSERAWQSKVLELAAWYGFSLTYHTYDSRRSAPGFPDLILLKGHRLLAVELKSEAGRLTVRQRAWLEGLGAAGVEVDVWRPSDVDLVVEVLAGRSPARGVRSLARV